MNREQPNDFKRIPELEGAETEPASIMGDAEGQKEAAAVAAGTLEGKCVS
jgi:hypothetical protein